MRYRRKLGALIDAVQWANPQISPDFNDFEPVPQVAPGPAGLVLWVEKSQAWCDLAPGDYVVREPDGHGYYPCKPDVFTTNYEPELCRHPVGVAECGAHEPCLRHTPRVPK